MVAMSHGLVAEGLVHAISVGETAGFNIACGVIDASGRPLGVLKHTKAGWASPEIALGKANVAVVYHTPTRALYDRWQRERPLFGASVASFGSSRGWYVAEGGVLVHNADGDILGAVGVAGCFPATIDDEVAVKVAQWFEERLNEAVPLEATLL